MNIIDLHKDLINKRDLSNLSKITANYFYEIMNPFYSSDINKTDKFNYNYIEIKHLTKQHLETFIFKIMQELDLDESLLIPALVYLDDFLITMKDHTIYKNTWKQLILISLLLSHKMYDDDTYLNKDFAYILSSEIDGLKNIDALNKINQWESFFLFKINFRLYLITNKQMKEEKEFLLEKYQSILSKEYLFSLVQKYLF